MNVWLTRCKFSSYCCYQLWWWSKVKYASICIAQFNAKRLKCAQTWITQFYLQITPCLPLCIGSRGATVFTAVCLFVCLSFLTISHFLPMHRGLQDHEFLKPIYFGIKAQSSRSWMSHKNIACVSLCTFVSAGFFRLLLSTFSSVIFNNDYEIIWGIVFRWT